MSKTIMITGGARSGKSQIAEARCLLIAKPAIYIATAQAHDDEMRERIAQHGVVARSMKRPERTLPETDFRRCVGNWGGQVRSSG